MRGARNSSAICTKAAAAAASMLCWPAAQIAFGQKSCAMYIDLLEEVFAGIWKALNPKNESKKMSELLLISSGIGIGKQP